MVLWREISGLIIATHILHHVTILVVCIHGIFDMLQRVYIDIEAR